MPEQGQPDRASPTPPSTGMLALAGLQHVLVVLTACIAVPLFVGRALRLPPHEVALLVNATVAMCGIGTLLQTLGPATLVGIRLPVITGVAFAALGPMLSIAGDVGLGTAVDRMQVIAGSTIAAGALMLLLTPVSDRLPRVFPPIVRGVAMLMIGIVLLRSAIGWIVAPGVSGVIELSPPGKLGMATLVLVVIVLVSRFARGSLANIAVVLGLGIGAVVAGLIGAMSLAGVASAAWVGLPPPMHFGRPRFELVPILSIAIAMIVTMIEAAVMFRTLSVSIDSTSADSDTQRGLRAEGLGVMLAGLLAAMPCTSFAAPSGLVAAGSAKQRANTDRLACAAAGLILLALGLTPKLGALAMALPQFVLAGAGLMLFGVVAATGVKILADVDYERHRQNLFIVAVSLGIGLIPLVAPRFFKVILLNAPILTPLLQSSLLLSVIAAVLLNVFFNGLGHRGGSGTAAAVVPKVG